MIADTEWTFFEAVEQRIRHIARHRLENDAALFAGRPLPWDPAELCARQAAIVRESDFPARLERALAAEPAPGEARRLGALHRWVLATLFETHPEIAPLVHELREKQLAFRPRVDGRETTRAEVRRILHTNPDGGRREEAWKAMAPLAQAIEAAGEELLRRREALARAVADAGFPEIAFHALDQDRAEVVGLLDAFERTTRATYQEAKREIRSALGVQEVQPWDMDYGLMRLSPLPPDIFDTVPAVEAAREQARRWGFDLDAAGVRWEACDLSFDAAVLPLEVPGDIRVLHAPLEGHDAQRAALNAAGRALRHAHVLAHGRVFDGESPVMIEAAGAVFEAVTRDPDWLAEHVQAPAPAIRTHLRAMRFARVVTLRRRAAVVAFENLVYAGSSLKPQRLHTDVMEQMLEETRRPDLLWPLDPLWVERPLQHASAVLGAIVAAQIGARLAAEHPEAWRREETGAWLREHLFNPGERLDWKAKVERAVGAPPAIDAFVTELDLRVESAALQGVDEISDEAVAEYYKDIDLSDLDLE